MKGAPLVASMTALFASLPFWGAWAYALTGGQFWPGWGLVLFGTVLFSLVVGVVISLVIVDFWEEVSQ